MGESARVLLIMAIPNYDDLFNTVIAAMHELGGSGSNSEIDEKVSQILKLTESEINEIHSGNRTVISYRLAWARYYLKKFGILENSSRGVWALTSKGQDIKSVDKREVNKFVKSSALTSKEDSNDSSRPELDVIQNKWEEVLLSNIMRLTPESFERLCQRILRESGFIQGIDGRGIIKIAGLMSFHVLFQSKRYAGSVSSKEIRDFRGAMSGRTDKGLFITTGSFTRAAKAEANRDGVPTVDLIDGDELVNKMKELRLGVKISTEEIVDVDTSWFINF